MLSLTQHTVVKLENLLHALNYQIRYEKGNFKSGTCLLQQENLLVINKFSDIEVKITSMVQVIRGIDLPDQLDLDEKQRKFLYTLKQMSLNL